MHRLQSDFLFAPGLSRLNVIWEYNEGWRINNNTNTPARPDSILPSFIFALYNENQKPGVGTERHFGLLCPNGSHVYEIDLSGNTPESEYKPVRPAENNQPYKGKIWCVVAEGANKTALSDALSYACSQGTNKQKQIITAGGNPKQENDKSQQTNIAINKNHTHSNHKNRLAITVQKIIRENSLIIEGETRKMQNLERTSGKEGKD